jgi:hypothetical protein
MLDLFDRKVIGWALSADMETCHTTGNGGQESRATGRADFSLRPRGPIQREIVSRNAAQALSFGSPEHEPEGKLLRPSPVRNCFSKR